MTTSQPYSTEDALAALERMMGDYHNDEPLIIAAHLRSQDERIEEQANRLALTKCPACGEEAIAAGYINWAIEIDRLTSEVERLRKVAEAVLTLRHEWNPEGLTDHDGNWFYATSDNANIICNFQRAALSTTEEGTG